MWRSAALDGQDRQCERAAGGPFQHARQTAIDNSCPHEDGPLGEGALCGRVASCPVQAYEFDVSNGYCLTEPAYRVERFEVHVEGDDILVSEEPAQS
ncbi:MAG TPA: nitrite reductase (NAD(P)H) small subunit [Candidatus Dormibacteraeota bacterium]